MGARTRIFKKDIIKDYKAKLSKDHKAEKQLLLFEHFCTRLARSVSYQYKVRGLKESLNIHHSTIKKSIERFVVDGVFSIEDLGQQVGYSIKFNSEILEQELDESFNPYTVDHTNKLQSKIDWINHTDFIGREREYKEIQKEIKKRKPIILLGVSGVGKTAILQKVFYDYNQDHNIIYANFGGNPFKEFLISIAYAIFTQHRNLKMLYFADNDLDPNGCTWPDIKAHVKAMKISDLVNVIIKSIEGKDYIIIIDHLEKLTPNQKSYLNMIMDYCCLIGASWELSSNKHVKHLWFRFSMKRIKPLEKLASKELINFYYKKFKIKTTHPKIYKNKIFAITNGLPAAIINCLKRDSFEPLVNRQDIRQIQSPQSVREFNMSFILVLLAAMLIASRFIALGVGDRTLYVFAGVTAAGFKALTVVGSRKKNQNTTAQV